MKATLLSVKEIALIMGVSTQSIRRSYWRGDIPAFRVCNMLRFDLEHVRQIFLAKGLPGGRVPKITQRATAGNRRRRARRLAPGR